MTTSLVINSSEKSGYLRTAMRVDAVAGIVVGIFAILDAGFIVEFMNAGNVYLYMAIGLGLLLHGAALLYFSRNADVPRWFVYYALVADAIWCIVSVFFMISSAFGIPDAGKWVIFAINELVIAFFVTKFIGLRRMS